jgi:hypothetical protein
MSQQGSSIILWILVLLLNHLNNANIRFGFWKIENLTHSFHHHRESAVDYRQIFLTKSTYHEWLQMLHIDLSLTKKIALNERMRFQWEDSSVVEPIFNKKGFCILMKSLQNQNRLKKNFITILGNYFAASFAAELVSLLSGLQTMTSCDPRLSCAWTVCDNTTEVKTA